MERKSLAVTGIRAQVVGLLNPTLNHSRHSTTKDPFSPNGRCLLTSRTVADIFCEYYIRHRICNAKKLGHFISTLTLANLTITTQANFWQNVTFLTSCPLRLESAKLESLGQSLIMSWKRDNESIWMEINLIKCLGKVLERIDWKADGRSQMAK